MFNTAEPNVHGTLESLANCVPVPRVTVQRRAPILVTKYVPPALSVAVIVISPSAETALDFKVQIAVPSAVLTLKRLVLLCLMISPILDPLSSVLA